MRKFVSKKNRNRESGYGLVFAAFGLIALLGAAGLSVDMGYLRYQRRLLQSAADSAALAGAAQLGAGGGLGQASAAALNDSQLNGFQDGTGDIHVTPTQVTLNGNNNAMNVIVANSYPTFFMRIFGGSFTKVGVSTTATAQYIGGRGCIYALTSGNGITVTGNVNVPNCNVISNQNISVSGGGSLTAAAVGANGTASNRRITPAAITPTQQASDPLSYLPTQGIGGKCDNTANYTNLDNKNGTVTLSPGKYCGISFAHSAGKNPGFTQNVNFKAGIYVITNNGLSFHGSGTVAGAGVTFYVGGGSVSFTPSQQIQLSAPTNAPYSGILFFQPTGNNNAATVNGRNGSFLQGALYFPNATLNVNGAANNGSINYMVLVAKTLNLGTNINFPSDYSSLQNGLSPVRTAALVQ